MLAVCHQNKSFAELQCYWRHQTLFKFGYYTFSAMFYEVKSTQICWRKRPNCCRWNAERRRHEKKNDPTNPTLPNEITGQQVRNLHLITSDNFYMLILYTLATFRRKISS
jgi:hypothetical protein